jgi:hypothetical protein
MHTNFLIIIDDANESNHAVERGEQTKNFYFSAMIIGFVLLAVVPTVLAAQESVSLGGRKNK